MFQDTRPAPLGTGTPLERWAEFRVADPRDVASHLRALRDSATPVHLTAPGGAHLATTLWAIDADQQRISFAAGDGAPMLDALLDADEAVAVAYLDSVKLQFDVHGLVVVRGARASALQGELPHEVYRFQRRGAYRVRPDGRLSPQAVFRHPSLPDMQLALRMLDVSSGGCALVLPHDVPPIAAGVRIGAVRVQLDADTAFEVMLTLQHVASIGSGDAAGVRLGCEWGPIGGAAQLALQRWIDQAQKRRRG